MNTRRALRICIAVLISYLLLSAIIGVIIAAVVLHPSRHRVPADELAKAPAWAEDDDASIADVSIVAADGALLKAWELRPEDFNGDTVLLLHGLRGNRLEMVNYADIFLAHGYGVLMPDARAHGDSGGDVATFGLLERDDIHRWVQWLHSNRRPRCVYGFGESMGAAELLQSLETEPQFCAVAAECPFSTFRESAYDRMGQAFHVGPWLGKSLLRPVVESAYAFARFRYGFNMDRVSPEDVVATSTVPVLLIHGDSDTNIPIRHSRRITARNPTAVLWEVPGTGHSNAIDTSPSELEIRLIAWFSSHVQSNATPTPRTSAPL
ncbi:MAG TPA: alpha/beta hydrolase [Candidatus Dormibacteraeota bacterium]|nr:alpha/beta hydrolase [Candidatus Dormibacteraeota bacterium]